MPKVSTSGSSTFSSRSTSAACRSPDASPATMASRTATDLVAGLLGFWGAGWTRGARGATQKPSNRATQQPSLERKRIHRRRAVHSPGDDDGAEEEGAEDFH